MARPSRYLLPAMLLAALVLVAAGCGGDDDEGAGTTTTATNGEGMLTGVVSDVGRFNDRGFNQLALEGCQRAESELGTSCRALESRSTSDYIPNFSRLIRDDAVLSVATGFLLAEATNAAAGRFPTRTSRSSTTRPPRRRSAAPRRMSWV